MKIYPVPAHFIHLPLCEQIAQGKNFWRAEESEHIWADGYTPEHAQAKLGLVKLAKEKADEYLKIVKEVIS